MTKPLSVLGELRVGAELLAAADVRSVRALTGNPDDTRVIARFSWHRSIANAWTGCTVAPSVDDPTLWTLIPGAMRPAYQVTEDDAGKWLRVTVMPLPSSSAGGRGTNSLEARASGTNRPTLHAVAGPILGQQMSMTAAEKAVLQEAQLHSQQSQQQLVVVEGQYMAVAEGGTRLMVHLNPGGLLPQGAGVQSAEGVAQLLQQQQSVQQQQQQGSGVTIESPRLSQRQHSSQQQHHQQWHIQQHQSLQGSQHQSVASGQRSRYLQPPSAQLDRTSSLEHQGPSPHTSLRAAPAAATQLQPDPLASLPPQRPLQHQIGSSHLIQLQGNASRLAAARSGGGFPAEMEAMIVPPPQQQQQLTAKSYAETSYGEQPPTFAPRPSSPQRRPPGRSRMSELQSQNQSQAQNQSQGQAQNQSQGHGQNQVDPPYSREISKSVRILDGQDIQGTHSTSDQPAPAALNSHSSGSVWDVVGPPSSTSGRWVPGYDPPPPAATSPSSRATSRLQEIIEGNYALSELQQWASSTASHHHPPHSPSQQQQLPLRQQQQQSELVGARTAVSAGVTSSPRTDEFDALIQLAEAVGDGREPWSNTNTSNHHSAGAALLMAPFLSVPQRQEVPSRHMHIGVGLSSELPQKWHGFLSEPPPGPPADAGQKTDHNTANSQGGWKGFLSEESAPVMPELAYPQNRDPQHCRSRSPAREAGYTLGNNHSNNNPHLPPSPFGERSEYAYVAAARVARVSSPLPPQQLESAFQSTQHRYPGETGTARSNGYGSSMAEDVGLSGLRSCLNAWQTQAQRGEPRGPAATSGLGGGSSGAGAGGGSLREALEQLLAQHQEIVQQATMDAAASQLPIPVSQQQQQQQQHATLGALPRVTAAVALPAMRPYHSDATTTAVASGPPLDLLSAVNHHPLPSGPEPYHSAPVATHGSVDSSVSLCTSFAAGVESAVNSARQDVASGSEAELGLARAHGRQVAPDSALGALRKAPRELQAQYMTQLVRSGACVEADTGHTVSGTWTRTASDYGYLAGSNQQHYVSDRTAPISGLMEQEPGLRSGDSGRDRDRQEVGRAAAVLPNPSGSGTAASSSSSSLQDMRHMNEALLWQLAESTRLQMQMQKALDAAVEQLMSLHAKEQRQGASEPDPAAATSMPSAAAVTTTGLPAAPQAPLPSTAAVGGDGQLSPPPRERQQQHHLLLRHGLPAAPALQVEPAPLGVLSSPLRRGLNRHLEVEEARDEELETVHRATSPALPTAGVDELQRRAKSVPKSRTGAAHLPVSSVGDGTETGTARGASGAGASTVETTIAGGGSGGGNGDASTAAVLRSLLHQHHLRWRAKKAKLKEQAQAWQYTAWRYATAWKKARAMLQALVAQQEDAAAAAVATTAAATAGAAVGPSAHSDLPHNRHGSPIPRDFRPLAPDYPASPPAAAAAIVGRQADARAGVQTAEEPGELRKLGEPILLAGIAAALQRRDPSPALATGQLRASAYPLQRHGRGGCTSETSPPRAPEQSDQLRSAWGPGGKAINVMREVARSPCRMRPRPHHRKRSSTTARGEGGALQREAREDDMLVAPDIMHPSRGAKSRSPYRGRDAKTSRSPYRGNEVRAKTSIHWSDGGLDSGGLRDQGSRGRSTLRRYCGGEGTTLPERMEVAAHWPATLRSAADGRQA